MRDKDMTFHTSPTCASFPGPHSHFNAFSASSIRFFLTNQVGDSVKKQNEIKPIKDGRAANADAVRQSTKAPRLEIPMIPTDTNVSVLLRMNPLNVGSASSSTNTCVKQMMWDYFDAKPRNKSSQITGINLKKGKQMREF
jgi:hypothetical protein